MSNKNNAKGYVGVYEYARELKLSLAWVYSQIYLGKIPAEKFGRKWQIKRTVMEAAMQKAFSRGEFGGGAL